MRLFVTGGTGFVGSHFLNAALRDGHEVRALRRPSSTPRVPLNNEPTWVEGDLDTDVSTALKGCDILVHTAAHGVVTPAPLRECVRWNVIATMNLLERARQQGVFRFVVLGSCFEYGRAAERYAAIPTSAPLEPTTPYAGSKAAASVAVHAWSWTHRLDVTIARVFHTYGEGEHSSRLWPSLRAAAASSRDFPMTAGEQIRDFVHVTDVAQQLLATCTEQRVARQHAIVTHIGSGRPQSVLEFCRFWWHHWNASGKLLIGALPYRENEMMRLVPEVQGRA